MGHMHVGPKLYPSRPRGAQIIQRGPHGYRFAADPVAARRADPSRRGFTWWSEQVAMTGGDMRSWLPRQNVEGVMGLGGLGAVSIELARLQNENYGAFQDRARQLFPTREAVVEGLGRLRVLVGNVRDPVTAERAADFGVLLREANMIHGGSGAKTRGRTISQLSIKAIRQSGAVREGGAPMIGQAPVPRDEWLGMDVETLKSELSRQYNPFDPRSADWGGGSGGSFPWTKVALGLAGVAFAYGLARSLGQGF